MKCRRKTEDRKAKTVDRKAKNGRSMRKDHESTVFARSKILKWKAILLLAPFTTSPEAKMPGRVVWPVSSAIRSPRYRNEHFQRFRL